MVTRACRATGFTLVELMVVLSVLSIFLGLAGAAFTGMVATQQVRSAAYDVHTTLSIARSDALTRNAAVTVEPVSGDWARGWTTTDSAGTVLRRQSAYARVTLSGPARIVFNADGRPNTTATPFAVSAADANAESHRCVRLRLNGRAAIDRGIC